MSNLIGNQEKVRRMFREEATENFAEIHRATASAASAKDPTELRAALRAAHSVKGGATIAGLTTLSDMIHNWESCAAAVVAGHVPLDASTAELLSRAIDAAQDELDARCGGSAVQRDPTRLLVELGERFGKCCQLKEVRMDHSPAPNADETQRADGEGTVRVAMHKLDRQMANVEELLRLKIGGERRVAALRKLILRLDSTSATELTTALDALLTEMSDSSHALSALADSLHSDARAIRMLPVASALAPFERMVRDLARASGKQVVLETLGGSTEVDRDVLEALKDPVMHLLRNAVDHGIERPSDRKAVGKQEEATVRIEARSAAGMLELEVVDDGRGVGAARIAQSAVARGMLSEDKVAQMAEEELRGLVFQDGFSTAERVTEVSGRGLGLAVVRDAVERLGGHIAFVSTEGRGTRVSLTLPLNLATSRLLLVEVEGQLFTMPAVAVHRVVRIEAEQLSRVDHGFAFDLHGQPVAVFRLVDVLGLIAASRENRRHLAVVVGSHSERAAFTVDRIVDEQELIARSLGDHVGAVDNVAGATVLADGRVVLILSVTELLRHARNAPEVSFAPSEVERKEQAKKILVVDDSITARTLEKSILEAAGYCVDVAVDGTEALERLSRSVFDLVVSDVQMPRMDGLALVRAVRQNTKLKNIPIVLVSSLDSPEQRQRGMELGADAYLGKAEFEQGAFLHTVDRFL